MALNRDYNKACPIFDWEYKDAGVLFPYFPLALGQADGNARYIDLDATASGIYARFRLPMKVRFLTCEAFACSDNQGLKAAAASTEAVLAINYGTASLASIDAGTQIAVITCSATGAIGKRWAGTSTPTTIETTHELIVHLKTAASSATSNKTYGGAIPVLWFALCNSPS